MPDRMMARIDPFSTMLEPAAVLPAQLEGTRATCLSERRLMAAVLEEAVYEYRAYADGGDPRRRRLYLEAAAWFASDDTEWPFSFLNICSHLDLSPSSIRAGVDRLVIVRARENSGGARIHRFRGHATNNRNVVGSRELRRLSTHAIAGGASA